MNGVNLDRRPSLKVSASLGLAVMWTAFGLFWIDAFTLVLAITTQRGFWVCVGLVIGAPLCIVGAEFARNIYLDGKNPDSAASEPARFRRPDDY